MNIEELRLLMEIAGYVAGIASVLLLGNQFIKERKLREYNMLQALEEKYTSLLWMTTEYPEIGNV